MKYSKQTLINQIQQGNIPEFLFFWGHQPRKDGKIGSSCFSQWWPSVFKDDEFEYSSTEQYMMAGKARLFNDTDILEEIMSISSPKEIKALGRKIRNFDEQKLKENRYDIVKKGNYLKFSQNADLNEFLLSTNDKIIVEASPYDNIWGIGLKKDHPDAVHPENWKGLNLLGFALMEVRDELV